MTMNVEHVMTPCPYTCRYVDTLERAATIMADHDCGCVPVVDDADMLVGLITDRDVCLAAQRERTSLDNIRVSLHMSSQVHACRPDETLTEAADRMRAHAVRRLAVTDPSGKLLGLLSLDDIAVRGAASRNPDGIGLDANEIADTLAAVVPTRSYGP